MYGPTPSGRRPWPSSRCVCVCVCVFVGRATGQRENPPIYSCTQHAQYDILVNAAGVSQTSLLAATPESDVVEILETNLQGTIWGCKAFLRQALKHRKEGKRERVGVCALWPSLAHLSLTLPAGCIINISSVLARTGGSGAAVYAASKAGVIGMSARQLVFLST